MNKEDFIISGFTSKKIGDDGAIVNSYVYSTDSFFENVHFKREWMSLYNIARKSMLVNISDAIAMNARAQYALINLAVPTSLKKPQLQELISGFSDTAKEYNIEIIGGDTIANTKLDISVTIISKTTKPLLRAGLKVGHILAYSGKLGNAKKALRYRLSGALPNNYDKFANIKLRESLVSVLTPSLSCGMDISDGLLTDLEKLSRINALGFNFFKKLRKNEVCSGEEYEMLFAFNPRCRKKIVRLAAQQRVPVTMFAKATRTKYKSACKANHF